jgi:hypothetical protein
MVAADPARAERVRALERFLARDDPDERRVIPDFLFANW